jgi:WD40 repeat protein
MAAGTAALVKRWTLADGKPAASSVGHNQPVLSLAVSPAPTPGNRMATVDYAGQLFIWDSETGAAAYHQQLPIAAAYSVAYSPDGKELLVCGADSRVLRVTLPAAGQ